MSGRLDYAKAKRTARGGESAVERWNTAGWRVEYPDEFPVTRRSLYDPREAGKGSPAAQPDPGPYTGGGGRARARARTEGSEGSQFPSAPPSDPNAETRAYARREGNPHAA